MIFTLLATIGGAIAAGASTVATTAVAVGGAVAAGAGAVATGAAAVGGAIATGAAAVGALGASALAAASAIGATTLIGGITISSVLAWGGGLFVIGGLTVGAIESAKTEGRKEGYSKASREYEAKLRNQAKEFFTQIAALKEQIESYRLQRDKAQELEKKAFTLLGKFEGCISAMKEQGRSVTDETLGYYKQLSDFTDKAA